MIGVESHCTSHPADSAYRSVPLLKNSSLDELTRSAMLAACSPANHQDQFGRIGKPQFGRDIDHRVGDHLLVDEALRLRHVDRS